jgi:hypothetical protein
MDKTSQRIELHQNKKEYRTKTIVKYYTYLTANCTQRTRTQSSLINENTLQIVSHALRNENIKEIITTQEVESEIPDKTVCNEEDTFILHIGDKTFRDCVLWTIKMQTAEILLFTTKDTIV